MPDVVIRIIPKIQNSLENKILGAKFQTAVPYQLLPITNLYPHPDLLISTQSVLTLLSSRILPKNDTKHRLRKPQIESEINGIIQPAARVDQEMSSVFLIGYKEDMQ